MACHVLYILVPFHVEFMGSPFSEGNGLLEVELESKLFGEIRDSLILVKDLIADEEEFIN